MTDYRSTWPHPWPPDYSEFPIAHVDLIEAWLAKSKALRALSAEQKLDLASAILTIDRTAWKMARELKDVVSSLDELRDLEFAAVAPKDRNDYMRDIAKLNCVDSCEAVRENIYWGNLGAAIGSALFVGRNEVGEFANIGRAVVYNARSPDRLKNRAKVPNDRKTIVLQDGHQLLARNPSWGRKTVADEIHLNHKGEPGFESLQMIYRDLRPLFPKRSFKKAR